MGEGYSQNFEGSSSGILGNQLLSIETSVSTGSNQL